MRVDALTSASYTLNYVLKYISVCADDFYSPKDTADYIYHTQKIKLISTFGIFFNFKSPKLPQFCHVCHQKIDYIFDLELVSELKASQDIKPPPEPPTLFSTTKN